MHHGSSHSLQKMLSLESLRIKTSTVIQFDRKKRQLISHMIGLAAMGCMMWAMLVLFAVFVLVLSRGVTFRSSGPSREDSSE